MHFVHSIWTKPMISQRRNIELQQSILVNSFTYATSAAYVKHNGYDINLYCDGFGQDILDFIPYDNIIHLSVPTHIPTCFWACGKFLTLEKLELGDIHIDGDVFLKGQKLYNLITDNSYDIVVQSIEDDTATLKKYYDNVRQLFINNNISTLSCKFNNIPSYNCGTIGFYNADLKRKYLLEYFTALKSIISNKECLSKIQTDPMMIPDLVLEQQFLYELSNNYKVNNLLGDSTTVYNKSIELNYQHILGEYKVKQLPDIMKELKYIDFNLYNKAVKYTKYLM